MARPKKHPDEKREERHNVRFTTAEKAHVEAQAFAAGIDVTEYLRRRALDYVVPSQAQTRIDPALVSELNRLGLELKAIGVNANQIALAANTHRRSRIAWEDVVAKIHELREQVAGAVEKVVGA